MQVLAIPSELERRLRCRAWPSCFGRRGARSGTVNGGSVVFFWKPSKPKPLSTFHAAGSSGSRRKESGAPASLNLVHVQERERPPQTPPGMEAARKLSTLAVKERSPAVREKWVPKTRTPGNCHHVHLDLKCARVRSSISGEVTTSCGMDKERNATPNQ